MRYGIHIPAAIMTEVNNSAAASSVSDGDESNTAGTGPPPTPGGAPMASTSAPTPAVHFAPFALSETTTTPKLMTREERLQKSLERMKQRREGSGLAVGGGAATVFGDDGPRIANLLSGSNENALLNFVAKVNNVYHEKLKKPAPFMTFVLCGMQSAGKSTIMERFLGSVLNIVQEGTGTRCPLDTTCIHDESCAEPTCALSGTELTGGGSNLKVDQVFRLITDHNKDLARRDCFSLEPIRLEVRWSKLQSLRFVDTPGIISNQGTGQDNREEIKRILRSELAKPNTKLCVLLEPKEFATNAIVDFCDDSMGGRDGWIGKAIFVMNKFDKQFDDSRSGSKTNAFFAPYHENMIFPYLAFTPTLAKEDLPPEELIREREAILARADDEEEGRFRTWRDDLRTFKDSRGGGDQDLSAHVSTRLGFLSAKREMREVMLRDTVQRIPEVLQELRRELQECQEKRKAVEEKLKFSDPLTLIPVVSSMAIELERRIRSYLDGDLRVAMKFPDKLQDVHEEIMEEEDSDWMKRELNHHTEEEDEWRTRIAMLEIFPDDIQPDNKFLGGKQYQRALGLFHAVLVESIPDPNELRKYVPNGAGYLNGGLKREDHEHAMTQITKACLKQITHPGINFLVKHSGCILRRLFTVALADIKQGEELSSTLVHVPRSVELFLKFGYDRMLWDLMANAADLTHQITEARYSTINPNLPTFHPVESSTVSDEATEESLLVRLKKRCVAFVGYDEAKEYLREDSRMRATEKKTFLSDERTAMVTNDEVSDIIRCSFRYIVALMEFLLVNYTFQLNHYLFQAFKQKVGDTFMKALASADWSSLCQPDEDAKRKRDELEGKIKALTESLEEVQALQLRGF